MTFIWSSMLISAQTLRPELEVPFAHEYKIINSGDRIPLCQSAQEYYQQFLNYIWRKQQLRLASSL